MTQSEYYAIVMREALDAPAANGSKISRRDVFEMKADMALSDEEWLAKHGAP